MFSPFWYALVFLFNHLTTSLALMQPITQRKDVSEPKVTEGPSERQLAATLWQDLFRRDEIQTQCGYPAVPGVACAPGGACLYSSSYWDCIVTDSNGQFAAASIFRTACANYPEDDLVSSVSTLSYLGGTILCPSNAPGCSTYSISGTSGSAWVGYWCGSSESIYLLDRYQATDISASTPTLASTSTVTTHATSSSTATIPSSTPLPVAVNSTSIHSYNNQSSGVALPTSPPTNTPTSDPKSSAGAIAGGVVGGLAGITLICFGAFFLWKRRQANQQLAEVPHLSQIGQPGDMGHVNSKPNSFRISPFSTSGRQKPAMLNEL